MRLLFVLSLMFSAVAARGAPNYNLQINVLKYVDILGGAGQSLRCLYSDGKFGYLITRSADLEYLVDVINDGKIEGEKSRMRAELKDYGTPFIVYLSVFRRQGEYGSYFELLLDKKLNMFEGGILVGDAMYTEAYFSKEGETEVRTLKPLWKKRMRCETGRAG